MPGKICEKCKAPYKGYGTICSPCRRQPGPEWAPCSNCAAYFYGFGGICEECQGKPLLGDGLTADVAEGGTGPKASPILAEGAPSPVARRRVGTRLGQTPTAAEQTMDCQACKEPIGFQKCVSADGVKYHEKCLTCVGCKALLGKVFALAPGGGRLCAACAPTCGSCRKLVIGQITKVKGSCYHPECFTCYFCKTKLMGDFVHDNQGRSMCQPCSEQHQEDVSKVSQKFQQELSALDEVGAVVRDRCSACREVVCDDRLLVRGKHYHPACFKCFVCKDQLVGSYSVVNYKDVCLSCASQAKDNTAPSCRKCGSAISGQYRTTRDGPVCTACSPSLQCAGCQRPIEGKCSQVGEKSYHLECFTCRACGSSLAGGFCSIEDDYFCGGCADKKHAEQPKNEAVGTCAKCSAALSGEYVDAGTGDRFHGSCFTCDGCSKALEAFALEEGQGKRRYLCEACA